MIFYDRKLTQKESEKMIKESSLDMIAYYKVLESAVFELMDKAQKDGWKPEKLLKEIEKLFE